MPFDTIEWAVKQAFTKGVKSQFKAADLIKKPNRWFGLCFRCVKVLKNDKLIGLSVNDAL